MNQDDPYAEFLLKEYKYFSLFLAKDQHYLGRAYAWLTRSGTMQRWSELTAEELIELQHVAQGYEQALKQLWNPDHMNYAWLGNFFHEHGGHGHMHFVPRYEESRTFEGITFADERWSKNYAGSEELKLPEEDLFKIRDALRAKLI